MTKEELEKEAEEYYEDETEGTFQICEDCCWFADAVQTAYVDSAEPREKRIEALEAQIEKMKSDVISERDEAKRLEDIITYTVLNNILAKWGIKEK